MYTSDFSLRTFVGGYDHNFTYLGTCIRQGTQFIVDAAVPLKQVSSFIRSGLRYLLLTHTHADHLTYLKEYLRRYPDLVVVVQAASAASIPATYVKPVEDGELVTVGRLSLEVIHTPGHYPDSICYLLDSILFTGDTLFVGRTGRTISTESDPSQLYRSVYQKLLTLPGKTVIYPGHDYGSQATISMAENIRLSPLLQAGDEEDFLRRMADYETQHQAPWTKHKE